MTIAIEPLREVDDLQSAVTLQRTILGPQARATWQLSHLLHIQQSGGLVLGARESAPQDSQTLRGILIDLIATVDAYPARRTVTWCVDEGSRCQGIGVRLRRSERRTLKKEGVDLVYWDVDALSSVELHVALNKLGGIATGYTRNALGCSDSPHSWGLPTDRLRIEWWIDSPLVVARLERELPLPHLQIGLHEITVLTKTTLTPTGARSLVECEQNPTGDHVLVEIPEDLSKLQALDHDAAVQWGLRSRGCIEGLFQLGYLGVGLIHEGGRSFLHLKKGTRRTELTAANER